MAKKLKHFYLEPEQCIKLERESESRGIPQAEIVRRAVQQWLKNKKEE